MVDSLSFKQWMILNRGEFDVNMCLCILLGIYCKARSETLCFSSMCLELGYMRSYSCEICLGH